MARYDHLPLYKATLDFAVYVERIVSDFSRYHKYTLGSELRSLSHRMVVIVIRANSAVDKKPILGELSELIEETRVLVHISKEVKAFHNFNSFEVCVRQLDGIGKQCWGWLKSQK